MKSKKRIFSSILKTERVKNRSVVGLLPLASMKTCFQFHHDLPGWMLPLGQGEVLLDFHVDALIKADVDIIYIGVKEKDAHWLKGMYAKAYKRFRPDFHTRKDRTGNFISVKVIEIPNNKKSDFKVIEHMISYVNNFNSGVGYSYVPDTYLIEIPGTFYDSDSWVSEKARGLLNLANPIFTSTEKFAIDEPWVELDPFPYSIVMGHHWEHITSSYYGKEIEGEGFENGIKVRSRMPVPKKGTHAWIKYLRHDPGEIGLRKRSVYLKRGVYYDMTKYRDYARWLKDTPYTEPSQAWINALDKEKTEEKRKRTGRFTSASYGSYIAGTKFGFGYTGIGMEEYCEDELEFVTKEKKVVIGKPEFKPSKELLSEYLFRNNINHYYVEGEGYYIKGGYTTSSSRDKLFSINNIDREDPTLIWLVELLEDEASEPNHSMKIIKLPKNLEYTIEKGEKIVEKHKIYT